MKLITFLLFVLTAQISAAQTAGDVEIEKTLIKNDSAFWQGYNTCNLDLMAQFLTADMEFYHDQGGIIYGPAGMRKSMSQNICNDSNHKVRRELVPGTLRIYLLKQSGVVYGAVLNGEHYFYNSVKAAPETRDGVAKFSHTWLLKNGSWKMHRILSYDHKGL